jgi:hypothetical protein
MTTARILAPWYGIALCRERLRGGSSGGMELDGAGQDNPGQSCVAADLIARARLVEVERRIDTHIYFWGRIAL